MDHQKDDLDNQIVFFILNLSPALWQGFSFFWLCDVGMRSPIVCVPTII